MEPRPGNSFPAHQLFGTVMGLITPLGIQASNDELYKGAIFGRDSLRVGLDLAPWLPTLSEKVIFSLAHLQATEVRSVADVKRPGQIPHEARFSFIGPQKMGTRQQEILAELGPRWGGDTSGVVYYGSADATPQFVRLVARHCRFHGPGILDEVVRRMDGSTVTIRESVRAAITWTEEEIRASGRNLLGFLRSNLEHGHRWQILQDGATSIIHLDGKLANADARVETIGLQGLAYDCLAEGAILLEDDSPADSQRWRSLAAEVRDATMEAFWMSEEAYFAAAIDRDPADGETPRMVRTLSCIPTELLETGIFDELPEEERRAYVSGIVRMAYGPDFLTPAGIRSRALRHIDLLPYPDYHGPQSCWGVTNSVFAAGLLRQGLTDLAQDIASRHIDALAAAGELYEFLYVDRENQIRHPLLAPEPGVPQEDIIVGTNRPEADQAWTVSFVLRTRLQENDPVALFALERTWQEGLEREILAAASDSEPVLVPAYLDIERARETERAALERGISGAL